MVFREHNYHAGVECLVGGLEIQSDKDLKHASRSYLLKEEGHLLSCSLLILDGFCNVNYSFCCIGMVRRVPRVATKNRQMHEFLE